MGHIRAVIFDWGGVLIDDPAPGLMQYCAQALGVPTQVYTEAHRIFGGDFQRGRVSESDFFARVCKRLGVGEPSAVSLWGDAFRHVYREKTAVFDLARSLRETGYKTGFLSNTEVPAMAYLHELGYTMFDAVVFSCAEGHAKPEPRIYEIIAERLDVAPDEAVFIDDRQDYLDGATGAGLATILFKDIDQLRVALTRLGVSVK